jgi:hypothetical protein
MVVAARRTRVGPGGAFEGNRTSSSQGADQPESPRRMKRSSATTTDSVPGLVRQPALWTA